MARALKGEEGEVPVGRDLKPVEFWLPDFDDPEVLAHAEAAAKRIARTDLEDDILDWLERVQKDVWESKES